MSRYVVDASVLIKTIVEETGTVEAVTLLREHAIVAPDLVFPECANVLWKKVRRAEFTREEAEVASQILQRIDMELVPSRALINAVVDLSLQLDHPAYDCTYLALARAEGSPLVTADQRLVKKLANAGDEFSGLAVALVR
ncbi:MAG: type II toxin-antitoxin system VapC family toxin [Xanthomonadales bacterium]|nr:type II toxin-antitoxin system VapC family toxin [Xanthomonadales bacterium]